MAKLEVYCTVNNCYYWDDGNRCGAERILITLDKIGRQLEASDDHNIQGVIAQAGPTPADHSMETCCHTFRPRARGAEETTLQL